IYLVLNIFGGHISVKIYAVGILANRNIKGSCSGFSTSCHGGGCCCLKALICPTDGGGGSIAHSNIDSFIRLRADLETRSPKGTIKQLATTKGSSIRNTRQFGLQGGYLFLQRCTVFITVGAVRRLQSQVTHTLQNIGRLL